MISRRPPVVFCLLLVWLLELTGKADVAVGARGVICTVHPLATQAGVEAFKSGGNAIDVALAAALALGVVDGHNSGLGGGCFILARLANGKVVAWDGREMAPRAATSDMFLREGKAVPELSQTGPLAVGVPGAFAAYERMSILYGKRKLADGLRWSADLAEQGFAIDRVYAETLAENQAALRRFPGTAEMLLRRDGTPYQAGETLRLRDLARTYRQLAETGSDWFYRGPLANDVANWMKEHGGILTREDFARYEPQMREPITSTYRGHEIIGFPPPSSGGVHVAQILNIVENFDIRQLDRLDPSAPYHLLAEAMKLAFADRAHWLGDADFAPVPRGLFDKEYAVRLAQRISLDRQSVVPRHDTPSDWETNHFGKKHTTHIAAADAEGNWVAITATINTSFGSKVVVPGTGLILNNQMDDFSAQPGVPNAFGLVGADANRVEPGKRPLSSMSPTIVLKDGRPILTVGAAGGPRIITQVVLTLVRTIDLDQTLDQSVAAPRIHHQWRPDQLDVEPDLPSVIREGLLRRGHPLQLSTTTGVTQAIGRTANGSLIGVSDPRIPGKSLGY